MPESKLLHAALAATLSIIVTGAAAWLVFGQDKVTRAEMVDYVNTQTPWLRERGEIQSAISQNAESLANLKHNVDALVHAQQELLVEQRILVTKFDAYLEDGR